MEQEDHRAWLREGTMRVTGVAVPSPEKNGLQHFKIVSNIGHVLSNHYMQIAQGASHPTGSTTLYMGKSKLKPYVHPRPPRSECTPVWVQGGCEQHGGAFCLEPAPLLKLRITVAGFGRRLSPGLGSGLQRKCHVSGLVWENGLTVAGVHRGRAVVMCSTISPRQTQPFFPVTQSTHLETHFNPTLPEEIVFQYHGISSVRDTLINLGIAFGGASIMVLGVQEPLVSLTSHIRVLFEFLEAPLPIQLTAWPGRAAEDGPRPWAPAPP